jgi:putative ABC transport system substrate-binding protein
MRLRARGLAATLAVTLLVAPLAAGAQPATKIARIAILDTIPMTGRAQLWDVFRQGLRELGYVEGRNLAIESRSADGKAERLPALAAELVRGQPDLIVTAGAPAAMAAKQATTTIPIVMASVGDPVVLGLVASLARPGGNITGLTNVSIELAGKRVELLKVMVPRVSRVAILTDEANPVGEFSVNQTETAAASIGLTLRVFGVRGPSEFASAFAAMLKAQVGALIVGPSAMFQGQRRRLVELAQNHRLPTVFTVREYTEAGGLMSYGPNNPEMYRRTASFVDKILKGAKPADLPVEQPTKLELIILRAARAIGLTIPQSLLRRADEVIE